MYIHGWLVLSFLALGGSDLHPRQASWLDRVVQYNKAKFIKDMQLIAPLNIEASIEKAPIGYKDSPGWDINSVARLLTLIRVSEKARPVRKQLRRMLVPKEHRRFMSKAKSYQFFPSLAKLKESNLNDFYYDDDDTSDSDEHQELDADTYSDVVVVSNPVEARLPSARISIKLLKEILEARAIAARQMPTTTKASPAWTWPSITRTTKKLSTSEQSLTTDSGETTTDEA